MKELYRNAQLRNMQIVYCTLWEECKQTQFPHRSWRERTKALMWYYSPTKNKLIYQFRANTYDLWLSSQYGKYNSNIFLFHPLGSTQISWLDLWIIIFHEENENFSDKIENIQKAESKEYSNPTSKLCSKLPECVNVLILQNLDIPGLPDYQILLCRILEKSDYENILHWNCKE